MVVSPEALLEYDLTLGDIFDALENNNQNAGGGVLTCTLLTLFVLPILYLLTMRKATVPHGGEGN